MPCSALSGSARHSFGANRGWPRTSGFTPGGTYGAYRIDAVRDGMHEGARLRLVDTALYNRSTETTSRETIQNGHKIIG